MTGPTCPHCGDLAHGCACPPGPYVGELSADVIYPCWLSDIDRANFAEHELKELRAKVARERTDAGAWTAGYLAATKDPDLAGVRLDRLALRLYPDDQLARIAFGEGAEVCHVARRLGEDVATDAAAGVYGPQLATLYRVADERDRLLRAAVAIRDARQRADALASHGTVAMVEAYEAEDAAIVALLALLPDPSPAPGTLPP